MPKLKSLTISGFRSFGAVEQTLNLSSKIAAVWGPNSKGKTSLAEAIEFLLTGEISRRMLTASSKDEFADALRNAHLAEGDQVVVSAQLESPDGTTHQLRRTLTRDYEKRQECDSRLEIDGTSATNADLERIGIHLSIPPLQAPVLAQHTLSYIFSVGPQDRATYFKTLLEVTDLDDVRNDIASLSRTTKYESSPLIARLEECKKVSLISPYLEDVYDAGIKLAVLERCLNNAAEALLEEVGEEVPESLENRLKVIEQALSDLRSKTFSFNGFNRTLPGEWDPPRNDLWSELETYCVQSRRVDAETRQLVTLFGEALKLPSIAEIGEAIDCPLCETELALSPARVKLIRGHVEKSKSFSVVERVGKSAVTQLINYARVLARTAERAIPSCVKIGRQKRREIGFTVDRVRELLADDDSDVVDPWLTRLRALVHAAGALRNRALAFVATIEHQAGNGVDNLNVQGIREIFDRLEAFSKGLQNTNEDYAAADRALRTTLSQVVDQKSSTVGWEAFLEIGRQPKALFNALLDSIAGALLELELERAIRQIDTAKERVLNDKFSDYSEAIEAWWERLRPGEPTFFSSLQPRKGARRTIDFKAGLAPDEERIEPKVRDVIAVFSHSQLHCLGLALFLAKAQREGYGFIVLDDPVLSSDEDYRVHFNSTVLTALLDLGIQTIILTQDHDTWEELQLRYSHVGISNAQIYIETPVEGTIIENTSDVLLAKINRAKSLARGGHPDSRKECGFLLRDAGERFCKEMLVVQRRDQGDSSASLTDYNGKILEWLCPRVDPLLVLDPSHVGKLAVFKRTVNRACHDNAPPGPEEMKLACGDIRHLVKEYLSR